MKQKKQTISQNKEQEKSPEQYKAEIESLIADLKRLQADFENYKKRVEKENHEFKEYCNKDLLFELLTFMDDFEHSLNSAEKASKEDLEKTLKIIYYKLKNLLQHKGIKPFISKNEKFDPFKHEVLMQEESDKENVVMEEFQKGYYYKDRILRHAKVKISKLKKVADTNEGN